MAIFLFLFLLLVFSVCLKSFQAGFIVSLIVSVVVAWISSLQNKVEALQQKVLALTNICEEVLGNKVQRKSRRKIAEDAMEVVTQADVKEEILPLAKKAVAAKVNYNVVKEKTTAKMEAVVEEDKKAVAVVIPAKVKLKPKATVVKNKQAKANVSGRGHSPIVWIAGFAAVLGAFYLVKYMVLHGFLGPVVRLTLLAFAGALSVICGAKLFNKKDFADHERIAQVLMGVGVTALYFCSYALSKLYFFAPEYVSFILMCAVSVLAIILTLKFNGMSIAILSMLGGLLTPMLVSGISLHMPFFSAYMLVFVGAFLYMAAALCSPLLFVLALAAGYVWAFVRLVCFDFYMYDSIWTMLLIGGIAVMTNCFSKRFDKQQSMGLNVVSLVVSGVFTVACLIKADFGILEWGICGIMLASMVVLALKDAQKYLVLALGVAIFLLVLMLFSMSNVPSEMVGTITNNMIIYVVISIVALLPIYCGMLARFPHIEYCFYNAVVMPMYYGVFYVLFGKKEILPLIGLLGAVLCLLPVLINKLKNRDEKKCAGILMVAATIMAVFCFGSGNFGMREWIICGLMQLWITLSALKNSQNYLSLACGVALFLLIFMLLGLNGTPKDLMVYCGIAAVTLLPIYYGLLGRFPHIEYSFYNGIFMPLFFGGAYWLFGKGNALLLYGLLGGVLCLLPVLGNEIKSVAERSCAGILVLTAAVMITFGLCLVLDTEVFVVMAAIEVLIFSAVKRTSINYLSYGLSAAVIWFLCMVPKAIMRMFFLLLPKGGDFIEFYASELSFNVLFSYGIIPMFCFAGAWLLQKDRYWRLILKIMTYIIAVSTLFVFIIKMKMTGTVYEINMVDYALITDALLVALLLIGNRMNEVIKILGGLLLLMRLLVMTSIISVSSYGSSDLSYSGVTFVLGLPTLFFVWSTFKNKDIAKVSSYALIVYSFALVTALLNVSAFGHAEFGNFHRLSGGDVFAYSCGWFLLGVVWMIFAFYNKILIKPAFGMIYFVIAKVFLYDVAALDDFWRIVSLFALAGALLAVSHFYTKCFKEA